MEGVEMGRQSNSANSFENSGISDERSNSANNNIEPSDEDSLISSSEVDKEIQMSFEALNNKSDSDQQKLSLQYIDIHQGNSSGSVENYDMVQNNYKKLLQI